MQQTTKSKNIPLTGFLLLISLAFSACKKPENTPVNGAILPANFVGDKACESCHEDLYASYKRTGMGQSVSVFVPRTAPEKFGGPPIYDPKNNLYYEAFVRNDSLYQREYQKDAAGKVIHERIHRADYVVGSGNATRSYMMNVNGYVTEMPLTWYVKRAKWDMSPGYTQRNERFERPINLECMTCHNNFSPGTTFTQNHFSEVALGIGCERCHGPGSKHVEDRLAGFEPPKGKPDPTIINGPELSRAAQLSVCQQCHVDGTMVFKGQHTPMTFRAGMPLSTHRSIFVAEEQVKDPETFGIASHGARLAQSACYAKSTMTCTTCHDPHTPVRELETDYFNQKCISCHQQDVVCERPEGKNDPKMTMTGNCISCHMQKSGTSDIPHVTFTDHWIRKTLPKDKKNLSVAEMEQSKQRTTPFTLIKIENNDPQSLKLTNGQAKLEAAIAYFKYYDLKHRLKDYLPIVIRYATEGFAEGANIQEARLTLGRAYLEQGNLSNAIITLEKGIREEPENAFMAYWLGVAREKKNDSSGALAAYKSAATLQPLFIEAQRKYANALALSGNVDRAIAVIEKALQKNPIHFADLWNNLGFLHMQKQNYPSAVQALTKAVQLDPNHTKALVNLGGALILTKQPDTALGYLERASRVDSQNSSIYGNIGYIYLQKGNKAKAKEMFQKVLRLNPNDQQAQLYLRQL
ncbi:MAG: tetratricopeptide repeat protein [Bacteroidetes Order II. Incertae sedis bacterium]|nr:tetratricopeptide repeat protein [Bacteroidetes Order II. bacterium]